MVCAECNEALVETANFCSSCGAPIKAHDDGAASATNTAAVKQYAKDIAYEASDLSKAALKSDLGKKMAAGAGLGALIAVPIPFVGPAVGAVVGAGIVAFRRFTKD